MKIGMNSNQLMAKRPVFLNRPEATKNESSSDSAHLATSFSSFEPSVSAKVEGTVERVAAGALGSAALGAGLAAATGLFGAVAGAVVLSCATASVVWTLVAAGQDAAGAENSAYVLRSNTKLVLAGTMLGAFGGLAIGGMAAPVLGVAGAFAAVGGLTGLLAASTEDKLRLFP